MFTMNRVQFTGNLVDRPEVKDAGSKKIAKFALAHTHRWTSGDEKEPREETVFMDCEMWGIRGEAIAKNADKGTPIFVEGRLKQERWKTPDNQNRTRIILVVEDWQFIAPKRDAAKSEASAQPAAV